MRFLYRSLIGLALAAITLGLLVTAAMVLRDAIAARNADRGAGRPAQERIYAARVMRLEPARLSPLLTAYGEVRARNQVDLRAAEPGRIVELIDGFGDGLRVGRNALIARIDPEPARTALELARADLRQAEAELYEAENALQLARDDLAAAEDQLRLRRQALDRVRGISGRGLNTATDLEAAELAASNATQAVVSRRQALASAEARLDQARINLDRRRLQVAEAERRLRETEIRAPFPGILAGTGPSLGALVAQNEVIAGLIDADRLEVVFRVSAAALDGLTDADGQILPLPVIAELEVSGMRLGATGRLARLDPSVGEAAAGRLLIAELDEARGLLPGDFVTVRVEEPARDDLALVPARALGPDGTVLVVADDDRLTELPVAVVRRQGDDALIRVGDLAGREIVVERTSLLGAGIRLRPLRQETGDSPKPDDRAMIELTPERRSALIAFVERDGEMNGETRDRILAALRAARVPREIVEQLESRMGG